MCGAAVVVTIGAALYEALWHRATMRPLLVHIAARHRPRAGEDPHAAVAALQDAGRLRRAHLLRLRHVAVPLVHAVQDDGDRLHPARERAAPRLDAGRAARARRLASADARRDPATCSTPPCAGRRRRAACRTKRSSTTCRPSEGAQPIAHRRRQAGRRRRCRGPARRSCIGSSAAPCSSTTTRSPAPTRACTSASRTSARSRCSCPAIAAAAPIWRRR